MKRKLKIICTLILLRSALNLRTNDDQTNSNSTEIALK